MEKVTAWYCKWCGFYTQEDVAAKYHAETCRAEEQVRIQREQRAAAQRAEQAANAAVEKLAREHAAKISALYALDQDAAVDFVYRLLNNLRFEVPLPEYSSWWDYAEQHIIEIATEVHNANN